MVFWSTYFSTRHFPTDSLCFSVWMLVLSIVHNSKRIRDAALYTIIHPSTFAAWILSPWYDCIKTIRECMEYVLERTDPWFGRHPVHNRPAHSQCECFEIQSFTIETHENQQETHTMWRGEYFFEEIKTVYIRARKESLHIGLRHFWRDMSAWPTKPDTAWGTLHKSRTCSHNSLIRKNKSRTCGRQIPDFLEIHIIKNYFLMTEMVTYITLCA